MKKYDEENLLALSGIQHFAFCKRQWALIHIEKQWEENSKTVEGKQLHERVDDSEFFESRREILSSRSIPIASADLGFIGVMDMLEFRKHSSKGIKITKREGCWIPVPVEYKRGKPKESAIDEVQLCAQAICLEEMLNVLISEGFLYYGETRHRIKVAFNESLRSEVARLSREMHKYYELRETPKPVYKKHCKACSMYDICMPKLQSKKTSVNKYIQKNIGE